MDNNESYHTRLVEKKGFNKPFFIYKITDDNALTYCLKMIQYFLDLDSTEKIFVEDQCFIKDCFLTKTEELKISKVTSNLKLDKIYEFELKGNDCDLCIVIGGDGTILWANNIFQDETRPPFLTFNLGTLGYMATYCCETYETILNDILNPSTKMYLEKRTFLQGKLLTRIPNRRESVLRHSLSLESKKSSNLGSFEEFDSKKGFDLKEAKILYALNDITIEREDHSHMINTEIYYNDQPLTVVKSNGIIIASPTGSTAYSLSAGGTIIHYGVDCFILNSICPHSLSFRPIAFPRGDKLKIILCPESKDSVVICDGIKKFNLTYNQGIEVEICDKHVDFILLEKCFKNKSSMWKQKIIDQLAWNNSFKNVDCSNIGNKFV